MEWIRMLAASLCIITILLHLIPEGKFVKYVKFYAGLLFFLIAAGPVLELFAGEDRLERMLQVEFLKEEYYDLETSVDGLEELKNERIILAYRQELQRQIRDLAVAYGLPVELVVLTFDQEDGLSLRKVAVQLKRETQCDPAAAAELQNEIVQVYQVKLEQVLIQ